MRFEDLGQDTVAKKVVIEDSGRVADVQAGAALTSLNSAFKYHTQGGVVLFNVATASLPANPVAGQLVYNSTTNKLNFYNGSAWEAVTSA